MKGGARRPGVFVTGTDTGVGKTRASQALIAAAVRRGLRVAPMKPVASGARDAADGSVSDDALALLAAANLAPPYARVNPFLYAPAIAPHIAAAQAGRPIRLGPILTAYAELAAAADWVVVEGVGGWSVPLGPKLSVADLARALELPVVLTVGMRLGCLNHALLTAAAVRAAGLRLAGWIPSLIEPAMPCLDENLTALDERLNAPRLGLLPYDPAPTLDALAAAVDPAALI